MSTATRPANQVHSFPLERPIARVRKRAAQIQGGSLPYFIAGEENRMVHFVASSETSIFDLGNPLLLIGPSGSGKTAIALHLAARESSRSQTGEPMPVLYYPAIDFARLYAEAVGADDLPPLRQEINDAPILVIDDLHLINDKSAAQDELAARIEERVTRGLPTLLTCKRLPSDIRGMRSLLVSRVLPGLTIPLDMPAAAARAQLLRELAVHLDLDIDEKLFDLLDRRLEPRLPTRALEAALKQVSLWCRMHDAVPSEDAIISAVAVVGEREEVSLAAIVTAVARYFKLKVADLRSSSRKQNLVRARSLAMFIARQLTSKSMQQIGEYFGGRDHTTVLHAIRKTELLLDSDSELQRAAEEVREKFSDVEVFER